MTKKIIQKIYLCAKILLFLSFFYVFSKENLIKTDKNTIFAPHKNRLLLNLGYKSYTMRLKSFLAQITSVIFTIFITSCGGPSEADVTLLYMTDVHGLLLQEDFMEGGMASSSLANFSTYKKIATADDPDRFVLLCGGDLNNGQPSIYYYNNIVRYEDHISSRVMNWLDFDAIQMGPNDLYAGPRIYRELLPTQYKMPYLCANAVVKETGECAMTPYAMIERKGVRIAVLGMIDPRIGFGIREYYYKGLEFKPVIESANEWIEKLKKTEKPDLIVGLFHTSPDAEVLENISGLDVLLLGFDHKSLPVGAYIVNKQGDTIRTVEPLPQAQEVARVDINLKREGGKWRRNNVQVQRITLAGYPADEKFCSDFAQASEDVNKYLSSPVGYFEKEINASDAMFGPSVLMDLIHNMQLWVTKAEISITNMPFTREGIKAGPFNMRDMFQVYKYENRLMVESMTGDEVRRFLEHAVDVQFNTMLSENDHLLAFRYNELGDVIIGQYGPELVQPHYVYSSAAGIKYVVDLTKPNGSKVTILSMSDGSPFDLEKTYRVAMNDYQAAGGGAHITEGCGWNTKTAEERCLFQGDMDMRMYFMNYLKLHTAQPECRNDWKLIPADWAEKGKARDMKLMKFVLEK